MDVEQRLLDRADALTLTERRIAEVVLTTPQVVGFGTVADLAGAAHAGTATVVRFAVKLGYQGFAELQHAVQLDLVGQLRPAAERIRNQRGPDDETLVQRQSDIEVGNVRSTLDAIDLESLNDVVTRLSDERSPVLIVSGTASRGVAAQFICDLGQLRAGCSMLDGNEIDILGSLALAGDGAIVLGLDLRRYDRWLVDALAAARMRGAWIAVITDSVLSPLATVADRSFVLSAASTGPFDSHVGTLALLNLLVVEVAGARRDSATVRLDRLETAWHDAGALTDD
jgi:DNA-binding MurR/RpiR family transcriptional regulator